MDLVFEFALVRIDRAFPATRRTFFSLNGFSRHDDYPFGTKFG